MNSNDNMSGMDMDMDMSMVMTFQSWSSYQLQILFDSWNVTTKGQFALSWFAVVISVVAYHGMKYALLKMEKNENSAVYKRIPNESAGATMGIDSTIVGGTFKSDSAISHQLSMKFRVYHALLSGLNYGMSLMLMLVAMTYNPWLFVALMIGCAIGDYIFAPLAMGLRKGEPETGKSLCSDHDCH
jgi:hypothetical protein